MSFSNAISIVKYAIRRFCGVNSYLIGGQARGAARSSFIYAQVRTTILRVSGNSGKNVESAKLNVFPKVRKHQTKSEVTTFCRRNSCVLGFDVCQTNPL